MENHAIVLFDGECKFCNGSVNFIINHDKNGYFKFAPNQSEIAQDLFRKYDVDKANIDSLVLIEDEKVYIYSTGALRIARKLNGLWSMFYGFILVPAFIRNFFYKQFAKYRIKLFGTQDACMMPTPEIRERFLG
jgi:predicted DCC family thiol-disulfide oxidoreductase YuxK